MNELSEAQMNRDRDILIVEDSPLQAELLRRLLEEHGYRVTIAGNGKEALSLLDLYKPVLIISDVVMPEMDGYELARKVKQDALLRNIPIFLLTNLSEPDDIIRGLQARADGYLTKPYNPNYLLSKIRSALVEPTDESGREDLQEFRITIAGKAHNISIDPQSFLSLLLSTYENTVHTNQSLLKAQAELRALNQQLEEKVGERTYHLTSEIDERKRTEEALLESSERLRSIVETAYDPIIGANGAGRITMWNPAASRAFGYSAEEAINQPLTLIIPERFRERHLLAFEKASKAGHLSYAKQIREVAGLRKDGTEFPIEVSFSASKTQAGMVFVAVLRNLTERKRTEEALRQSKDMMEALLNATTDSMFLLDAEGKFLALNRTAAERLDKTAQELLGKAFCDCLPPAVAETRQARIEEVVRTGKPVRFEDQREGRVLDNSYYPVFGSDGRVEAIAVFKSDITDRRLAEEQRRILDEHLLERNQQLTALTTDLKKKTEELQLMTQQLWQTAKLATIGELAASIAHELNNPLATVSLRTEGLLSKTPSDHQNRRSLEIIEQELDRMGNLVANLLQFSRRYGKQISTINPREEMDKTLELIHGHLRNHGIEVVRQCSVNMPVIRADRQQLRQVFLNLITNASDAMPTGGTLTIRSDVVAASPGYVLIQVADTGTGIEPETLKHVMEPFFTTKPEGKGTGLGLPICKRIVQDHGGTLDVTSEVGKGTEVSITLPLAQTSNTEYLEGTGGPRNDNQTW